MEKNVKESETLQWHPAFYAELQIEFWDERENLVIENEHQLSTKPLGIDVLIVKKEKAIPIEKNIGRIFRKHNIIEYKSPTDYLSIDDFYKVYGYAYFYKSDTGTVNGIPIDEITLTYVVTRYPAKIMNHLITERHYEIQKEESGIYYVKGDYFPIQFVVTSRLSEEKNFWLKNLTNQLESKSTGRILDEYGKHKKDNLYKSVMNVIVRANKKAFKEEKEMCEALMELMKDELDEAEQKGREEGHASGIAEGHTSGVAEGKTEQREETVRRMLLKNKFSYEEIAELSGASVERVKEIEKSMARR